MLHTDPPIIVEEDLSANKVTVWKAITKLELMVQWYFDNIEDFQAKVGFETRFLIQNEGRNFTHLWRITEVIPEQKISYEWTFEEHKGKGLVHFELFESENGTKIRLTNEILEDFPEGIPEFEWNSCLGGWNYFIKDRLKGYLG